MRAFVYWNIRKRCYSIRYKGNVIAHAKEVLLADPEFVVSEAGRQRVLDSGHKNVHAGVRGEIVGARVIDRRAVKQAPAWSRLADIVFQMVLADGFRVRYNPKTGPYFVSAIGDTIVHTGKLAALRTNNVTKRAGVYVYQ